MNEIELLLEEDDGIALRTRIHLLNDTSSKETERLEEKVMDLFESTQLPDGSWERTIYKTLPHLHLLIDILKVDTKLFQNGFNWILSLKGPMGFHEYWEEGMTIHGRDVNCPYGCKLGTPEFSGRVLYLFGRSGYDDSIVEETIENVMQFHRYDGGFHGPRFWEEDKKSCPGATLWVTRGLLSLGKEQDIVEEAVTFIEQEDIADTPYQSSTSALALETLFLHTPKETACVAKHIKYLLSLRDGEKWRFRSYNETKRQMRANIFMVLNAIQKFRPHILGTLQ
ncbi:MAG: terpene cyclase/mutase family protein [Candidatus Korarchaeota archaeon]|nr:terpene cyclase/mutase family protein [Candidatus Korarchaeota archaeon]NIU83595.1 hypothetical protein [Candidatus Thorarchaeota archaeon]NIW13840.1 hypothetical protein [Candidatus Thorarchaeota archaeon]